MSTLRELLEKCTPGPWLDKDCRVDGPPVDWGASLIICTCSHTHKQTEQSANAQLIARLNPETVKAVLEALTLADLNYTRTNHSQPDMMGDDEHEAWGAVKNALRLLNTPTK